MVDSVKTPFPRCIELLLENVRLDPGFRDFYYWSREAKVPVIVLSSGMTPIIRALLVHLIGTEAHDIEIVCNEVVDRPPLTKDQEGGWNIQYHDDSDFGHDKSLTIRPYSKYIAEHPEEGRPILFYAGDGTSDLSAARETDLLFAKKGHGTFLLEVYWRHSLNDYYRSGDILRARGTPIYGIRRLEIYLFDNKRHLVSLTLPLKYLSRG